MTFNVEKFKQLDLQLRTKNIPVTDPDIAACFDIPVETPPEKGKGKKGRKTKPPVPVWTVRNLTGPELARVNAAVEASQNMGALVGAIMGGGAREKAEAIKETLGLGDQTPADLVRRYNMLELASVSPKIDKPTAVLLALNKAKFFYHLTNEITMLTGDGNCPGKQIASGETPG